jgi:hypothetical protein
LEAAAETGGRKLSARASQGFKALVIIVIALALLAAVIDELTPHAGGPASSSYATSADGLAGYAELLTRAGHSVARLRVAPAQAALDPRETVVLLDPSVVLPDDVSALRRFLAAGGRLIAGGPEPGAWVSELIGNSPVWGAAGQTTSTPLLPVPETAGVRVVQSAGEGSWSDAGGTLPVLGDPRSSLLTVRSLGAGRISLLADASPLQNRLLADADNAQLGLALAGEPGRPVAFDEAAHGYGQSGGLAALPTRWKWALLGAVAAALLAVAARIRRLGPAEPPPAPALPPRRAHVEALASALARTGQPGQAAEPVHRHARALVLRRAGLPASASAEELDEAAARLGLDPAEVRAITPPELADGDVLAAGSALAKLSGVPS